MPKFDWSGLLRKHPIFGDLAEQEIRNILTKAKPKSILPGQNDEDLVILKAGQIGDAVYLIGKGTVAVVLGVPGNRVPIATLGVGEFFGEMAFFQQRPRAADVVASSMEATELLEIPGPHFNKMLEDHPKVQFKVLGILSDRLRRISEQLVTATVATIEDKLKLIDLRMQSELTAVNASLAAAKTVYDQTSARANEVIQSAERRRTQWTIIGSAATVILTIFGYLGVDQARDTWKKAAEINELHGKVEAIAKVMAENAAMLEQRRKALMENYKVDLLDRFIKNLGIPQRVSGDVALDNYKYILDSKEPELIDKMFGEILQGISSNNDERRIRYRWILETGLNNGYPYTARERVLAYFLLLLGIAIENRNQDYERYVKEYERYVSDNRDELKTLNKAAIAAQFGQDDLSAYVNSLPVKENQRETLREDINRFWNRIPN